MIEKSNEIDGNIRTAKRTTMHGILRILFLIVCLLAILAPASAEDFRDSITDYLKDALAPLIEALIYPILPVAAVVSLVIAYATPLFGDDDSRVGEKAKKTLKAIIISELLLGGFWVLAPIFSSLAG